MARGSSSGSPDCARARRSASACAARDDEPFSPPDRARLRRANVTPKRRSDRAQRSVACPSHAGATLGGLEPKPALAGFLLGRVCAHHGASPLAGSLRRSARNMKALGEKRATRLTNQERASPIHREASRRASEFATIAG